MMNNVLAQTSVLVPELLPALATGMVLGGFFFAGLWWTVRKLSSAKFVALWFLGSLLLRTAIVVGGFYFLLGNDWRNLLAGLLGFIIARFVVIRLSRKLDDKLDRKLVKAKPSLEEADNASQS